MKIDEKLILSLGLAEIDRTLHRLIQAEEQRQQQKIILIPSESLTPKSVREALGSAFTSIYAEGYPREEMMRLPEGRLTDVSEQLAYFRRYSDRRFYKGVEFADLVESLACRRIAECFANDLVGPDDMFVNIQALSGAAANMAIYDALLSPGDTIMAMDLTQGGHLSHGSPFHQSGRRFKVVAYGVDPRTERLDYDRIMDLAREHRPKMIIAGYTSYPWAPDWRAFRKIADHVGAYLFADIAHTAGMTIAGAYPSPVGYADVIMFTTHKTLLGPRGAVILSFDPEIAQAIDTSVFPGAQGGPHVNKFAAIACACEIARTEAFCQLQHRIVENARHLSQALADQGLRLSYGGTDTHLVVIDLRAVKTPNGEPLLGETAARILDLVGIVVNKNTIPGDTSAADAKGIRLGTPWITERGMGKKECEAIAQVCAQVLTAIHPFTCIGVRGPLPRGKVPLPVLMEAKAAVQDIVRRFCQPTEPVRAKTFAGPWLVGKRGDFVDLSDCTALLVRGGKGAYLLHEASSAHILSLVPGQARRALFFDGNGHLVAEAIVGRLSDDDFGREQFLVLTPPECGAKLLAWLSALSDGYVLFDQDIFRKVQGPAVVEDLRETGTFAFLGQDDGLELSDGMRIVLKTCEEAKRLRVRKRITLEPFLGLFGDVKALFHNHPELFAPNKPYFVGSQFIVLSERKKPYMPISPVRPLRTTPLTEVHRALGAKMIEFAGYEMPVWYSSALDEHRAVRTQAGLFDLGHMGVFEVAGRFAESFLNLVTTNYAGLLNPGQSQYAFMLTPEGKVIDDLMVYRLGKEKFLLVVNAANAGKDWDWLFAVNSGKVLLDPDRPWIEPDGEVELRDLGAPGIEDGRVDLALQGPASRGVLSRLLSPRDQRRLRALRRTEFIEVELQGKEIICARTGYTGEPLGYELYVHPKDAKEIWELILDAAKDFPVVPCGLAARDSLRTEAGLPLYGHELAGEHDILPHEAGLGAYVKLHKPFFVGRSAYLRALSTWSRKIIRFRIERGARPVRSGAKVVNRDGKMLGWVTSCAAVPDGQIGMCLVHCAPPVSADLGFVHEGDSEPFAFGKVIPRFPTQGRIVVDNTD